MTDRWSTSSPGSRQYTAQTDGVATITLSTADGCNGDPAPVERAQRVQLVQDYWRNKERAS